MPKCIRKQETRRRIIPGGISRRARKINIPPERKAYLRRSSRPSKSTVVLVSILTISHLLNKRNYYVEEVLRQTMGDTVYLILTCEGHSQWKGRRVVMIDPKMDVLSNHPLKHGDNIVPAQDGAGRQRIIIKNLVVQLSP